DPHKVAAGSTPTFAPGSESYCYAHGDELIISDFDNEANRRISVNGWRLEKPQWSPDGLKLGYTAVRSNTRRVFVHDLHSSVSRLLVESDRDNFDYVWAPDSSRIYYFRGENWQFTLWRVDVRTGDNVRLISDKALIYDLSISPDGGKLAYTATKELDFPRNNRDIFVHDLETNEEKLIADSDADEEAPRWGLRGENIYYCAAERIRPGYPRALARASLRSYSLADGVTRDIMFSD
ncbi:MAG: PD40 domain-containing protein, partial [Candidatus Hydrogenedentota bacterium]